MPSRSIEKKGILRIKGYDTEYDVSVGSHGSVRTEDNTSTDLSLLLDDGTFFDFKFPAHVGFELRDQRVTYVEESERKEDVKVIEMTTTFRIYPSDNNLPTYRFTSKNCVAKGEQ